MKTKTTIVPEIIDEAKAAGCENADQVIGYLAGEVSRLRSSRIIDAACEVAAFSKTNAYPQEGTPLFFDFAQKLDALATAINAEYPNFNRNVRMGGANIKVSHD